MSKDCSSFSDARLNTDIDYAGKQYAASVIGELLKDDPAMTGQQIRRILVDRALNALPSSAASLIFGSRTRFASFIRRSQTSSVG